MDYLVAGPFLLDKRKQPEWSEDGVARHGLALDPKASHGVRDAEYSARDGRRFGLTVGIAFLVLSGILLWRERLSVARGLAALGGLLSVAGLLVPRLLRPVDVAWMKFAEQLSKVTTPVFMGIVFYMVFTPIGLVRRMFGRNPLVRPASESVWAEHTRDTDLRRQF